MQRDVKELLTDIVDTINCGGRKGSQLWWILSALRGPDNGNGKLKEITTGRLRYAVGLQSSIHFLVVPTPPFRTGLETKGPDRMVEALFNKFKQETNPFFQNVDQHFVVHYGLAIGSMEELGLIPVAEIPWIDL